jgi:hypothetical protein
MGLGQLQVLKKLGIHVGRVVLAGMNNQMWHLPPQFMDYRGKHDNPWPGADNHSDESY